MDKKNILIIDRFHLQSQIKLQVEKSFNVQVLTSPPLEESLQSAHAIITRTKHKITKELLDKAPNLKLIVTVTSGFDHIDVKAASDKNIHVIFTPEGNQYSAAEMTFALMLAVSRKVPQGFKSIKENSWDRELLVGSELYGKTLGIVGLGRIGKLVAARATAFGMHVIASDPYIDDSEFKKLKVDRVALPELVRSSDVISFHVPFTKETYHMGNRNVLELCQPGCLLINTSRGPVMCEPDVLEALEKGWIAGAGLDVFENEPLPKTSPLLKLKNVVLTPHCGANTHEAFERGCQVAAERVLDFFIKDEKSSGDPRQEPWFQLDWGSKPM